MCCVDQPHVQTYGGLNYTCIPYIICDVLWKVLLFKRTEKAYYTVLDTDLMKIVYNYITISKGSLHKNVMLLSHQNVTGVGGLS